MSDLCRLEGVEVARQGKLILDIPSLSLAPGELLTVVGSNGAGKSTLLRVMALVLAPTAGNVYFDGQAVDMRRLDAPELLALRRRITMVFQSPVLLSKTVAENVAAGLEFREQEPAAIARATAYWLDRLGVAELAGRMPQGLSGGEIQRVALARALVLQPDLLLLDEPTANLDAPTRARLLGDLRGILAELRAGAVLVTHEVREAPYFADRMLVLGGGRIRQEGRPDQVIDNPVDRETASFLGFDNILPAALLEPAAYLPVMLAGMDFCIRPEDVQVLPLAASDGSSGTAGRVRFAARVTRIAPWGPAFRITGNLERAPSVAINGLAQSATVREGLLREGERVCFEFLPSMGAFVPSD